MLLTTQTANRNTFLLYQSFLPPFVFAAVENDQMKNIPPVLYSPLRSISDVFCKFATKTTYPILFMIKNIVSILSLCNCLLFGTSCTPSTAPSADNRDLSVADSMFTNILDKYNVEKYGLLQETYPANPDNQVTYLAEGAEQKRNQEVSFLWPYSGMLSGGIALYKTSGDE